MRILRFPLSPRPGSAPVPPYPGGGGRSFEPEGRPTWDPESLPTEMQVEEQGGRGDCGGPPAQVLSMTLGAPDQQLLQLLLGIIHSILLGKQHSSART